MSDVDSISLQVRCEQAGPRVQFGSARGFEWTHVQYTNRDLPAALDGLRIVHLSDFHCRRKWDAAYDELIARLRGNPPDLILFTGDFVESKRDARPALPVVRKLFSALPSRLGTYAILGNHDGDLVGAPLAGCNVTLLDHHCVQLDAAEACIELIGLPGVDRMDMDRTWVGTLGEKKANTLRIVLCHYPDILPKVKELNPDLYLCGHTHGGQIALPNGLPIFRHDTLPRNLCSGVHRAYGTALICNRGFGFSSPLALRIFCPSEVVEILTRRN